MTTEISFRIQCRLFAKMVENKPLLNIFVSQNTKDIIIPFDSAGMIDQRVTLILDSKFNNPNEKLQPLIVFQILCMYDTEEGTRRRTGAGKSKDSVTLLICFHRQLFVCVE